MASSVTETIDKLGPVCCLTLAVTAHTDGSVTAYPLTKKFSGRLLALETDPGATAPTANYDLTITDANGLDVLQGVGANRHTSNTEMAAIVFSGTAIHPPVAMGDTLTLNVANNSQNGATFTVKLYFEGKAA
jgi:hypothetical protein